MTNDCGRHQAMEDAEPIEFPSHWPVNWKNAVASAVAALYFDDSYDFRFYLIDILKSLAPELLEELGNDAAATYQKSRILLRQALKEDVALKSRSPGSTAANNRLRQLEEEAKALGYTLVPVKED